MKRVIAFLLFPAVLLACRPPQSVGNIKPIPADPEKPVGIVFFNADTVSLRTLGIYLATDGRTPVRLELKSTAPSGRYRKDTATIDPRHREADNKRLSGTAELRKDLYRNIRLRETGEYRFEIRPLQKTAGLAGILID